MVLLCALLLLLALEPGSAIGRDRNPAGIVGINRVNLAWLAPHEQGKILGDIAASGVTHVRLSLSAPVDRSIDAVEIAHRLGLKILLEIQLSNPDYYADEVRARTGFGRIWDIRRLSDLDPARYRENLKAALRRMDEAGVKLMAVEPGNEINYSAYNGDLIVFRKPGASTPRRASDIRNSMAFERGLATYVEIARITRQELKATIHSSDAAVVSAGLSDMSAGEADQRGMERLDPEEVISLLRLLGLDEHVDAYGIHVYPGRKAGPKLSGYISELLRFCGAGDRGKPCWITEWGVANSARSCPLDDRKRTDAVAAIRSAFRALMSSGRLTAAFYYDWDTHAGYGVWRCGHLSSAGLKAIAPN
ncbi:MULTISPECIES: glycoside hydrolase [unclassified Ensifer]|uniref:glycoside hydrolase n=1 Tax=unclassified Ensifer TaxID=2633371 RepID=UPI000B1C89B3|nr:MULTISPECIES: glycoside hydrolase [unclassified Ensifer]